MDVIKESAAHEDDEEDDEDEENFQSYRLQNKI